VSTPTRPPITLEYLDKLVTNAFWPFVTVSRDELRQLMDFIKEDRNQWIMAALMAQEALMSIRSSGYAMPPSQYGMMYAAISEIQKLWMPELERRRKL
jgi:hypothetical protein